MSGKNYRIGLSRNGKVFSRHDPVWINSASCGVVVSNYGSDFLLVQCGRELSYALAKETIHTKMHISLHKLITLLIQHYPEDTFIVLSVNNSDKIRIISGEKREGSLFFDPIKQYAFAMSYKWAKTFDLIAQNSESNLFDEKIYQKEKGINNGNWA